MNQTRFLKLRRAVEIWGYISICLVPLVFILKSMEYNGRGDDTWEYLLGYGAVCVAAAKFFTEVTTIGMIVLAVLLLPLALTVVGIASNFLR